MANSTAVRVVEAGVEFPLPKYCGNGCSGNTIVEIWKKMAVACHPVSADFLVQPKQQFIRPVDPATLPCQQCRNAAAIRALLQVEPDAKVAEEPWVMVMIPGVGTAKRFRRSTLQLQK